MLSSPLQKFIATPQGIAMDNLPLDETKLHKLSSCSRGYISKAVKLLRTMTSEDWQPPVPHDINNVPKKAQLDRLRALASPIEVSKYNFNPDQARDDHGRWAHEGGDQDEGKTLDSPVITSVEVEPLAYHASMTHDDYVKRKQDFVDAYLAPTEKTARQLNVPMENLLGIAAVESLTAQAV